MSGATAEQFKNWRDHAKICSVQSLKHIIKDCKNAEEAMRGWNAVKENYYRDQYFTYVDELRSRYLKGVTSRFPDGEVRIEKTHNLGEK